MKTRLILNVLIKQISGSIELILYNVFDSWSSVYSTSFDDLFLTNADYQQKISLFIIVRGWTKFILWHSWPGNQQSLLGVCLTLIIWNWSPRQEAACDKWCRLNHTRGDTVKIDNLTQKVQRIVMFGWRCWRAHSPFCPGISCLGMPLWFTADGFRFLFRIMTNSGLIM